MASPSYSSAFYTTPNGTETHYLQTGNVQGPLLLALHGLGGSTATFEPLVPHLPQSYNIILVDFQGYGKTKLANPQKPLSIDGHVSDLHHLVAHLQASGSSDAARGKITILGHSLGTIVGLHYTAQHPDNVAGLALLGSGRSASHIPAARQGMLDTAAKTREQGITYAANLAMKTNFPPDSDERTIDPRLREAVRDAVAASDQEGYAQTCEAIMGLDHKDPDYSKITAPAVFIAGDMDPISEWNSNP
jgi:3-oxoadipate enol-lactonase